MRILLLVTLPAASLRAAAQDTPFNEQILKYVNQFRAQNGKAPLKMNPDMVETAGIHSTAMAKGTRCPSDTMASTCATSM